jgi:cell division protein FtsL
MATATRDITKKELLQKSSNRAALYTLIGVLLVAGALIYSFYQLRVLDRQIAAKQTQLSALEKDQDRLEQQIRERKEELARTQLALKTVSKEVPQPVLEQTIKSNPEIKQAYEDAQVAAPYMRPTNTKDDATAAAKEREGFQALIDGQYDRAIAAFQSAENAYNGYHMVYDLAILLRRNKAKMNDPAGKKAVFQTIVKSYSYKAPADLWPKVVSIANQ